MSDFPLSPDSLQSDPVYPLGPGFHADQCSRDAAESMKPKDKKLRNAVKEELQRCPGTTDEIADRMGRSIMSIRPRCSQLRKLGEIEPTGERRKNRSGKSANVWRVV